MVFTQLNVIVEQRQEPVSVGPALMTCAERYRSAFGGKSIEGLGRQGAGLRAISAELLQLRPMIRMKALRWGTDVPLLGQLSRARLAQGLLRDAVRWARRLFNCQ